MIKEIKEALSKELYFSALTMALIIPATCWAIQFSKLKGTWAYQGKIFSLV